MRVEGRAAPPAAGQPLVVDFQNVTKTFDAGTARAFTAIKDVTFAVEDMPNIGEFIGVLGPSGCGKSTVLRLIAGLAPQFPATTGTVLVHGEPVTEPGPDRGFVFQDYANFPHRTVLDNVAFGLECQQVPEKERRERAREWIAKVGLDPKKDAQQIPAPTQRRHEPARGHRPHADHASAHHPDGRAVRRARSRRRAQRMQDLLVSLWRELEATVFFITHDVPEAVYLGDRVFIFTPSPGTIAHQFAVAPPDRPAREMQTEPAFLESVRHVRSLLDKLEEEKHKHSS